VEARALGAARLLEELRRRELLRRQEVADPHARAYTRDRRAHTAPFRVNHKGMDAVVTLDDVRTFETSGGNVRYVARDADGNEYTTFREAIGNRARELAGQRVRIEYHENQRGRYTNVYLDKIEPAPPEPEQAGGDSTTDAEEAAWRTAVEAAPWLVGESEPHEEVPPDELYEKLKPFQEQVAEDIKESDED
jgi:hypothetical protein